MTPAAVAAAAAAAYETHGMSQMSHTSTGLRQHSHPQDQAAEITRGNSNARDVYERPHTSRGHYRDGSLQENDGIDLSQSFSAQSIDLNERPQTSRGRRMIAMHSESSVDEFQGMERPQTSRGRRKSHDDRAEASDFKSTSPRATSQATVNILRLDQDEANYKSQHRPSGHIQTNTESTRNAGSRRPQVQTQRVIQSRHNYQNNRAAERQIITSRQNR